MRLEADPLAAISRDNAPVAIHARLRWMNGGAADRALAKRVIDRLRREQSDDGSWGASVAATIRNLFDLWLLGQPDRMTAKAVDWLLEMHHPALRNVCGGIYDGMFFRLTAADRARLRQLRSLPFTAGCSGFVKTGAALFFATVFGQGDARRVSAAYERAERVGQDRNGRWCSASCGNNILQAVAVHPQYSDGPAMRLAVQALRERQDAAGAWSGGVPFFPTLMALSRVRSVPAQEQVRKALQRAARVQNKDGSFGRTDQAFHAFVVLDAMERTGSRADARRLG